MCFSRRVLYTTFVDPAATEAATEPNDSTPPTSDSIKITIKYVKSAKQSAYLLARELDREEWEGRSGQSYTSFYL